ncbi:cytochrome b560 subunit of succinate dehydrogenase [Saitoella complicata NRRL Y-17804]|uniref:cytochrome b560 subunit of succinate dehydrogenase n=1 Tax=Saitoella complicata (strain BCRC 22490 / CBS 7301 / JCM 7358 / NBRC 10748 / NRRL Y-17804) TaxID=698492 RepID=UPI000867BFB0|nr:cytochrome b560 subunit of succinate dehydrogenase [Saitoella complicata NRRL Y-17804]ODQ54067.1 cytochrome b560 subunit of succinate dehydrogenase [Saitoella complicata NRRL Y-17804]
MGIRTVQTQNLTHDESLQLLYKQRAARPNSPHLTIYQPQLTWYMSAAHRITGCAVSGGLYAFAFAYLASPYIGLDLSTTSLAASFGALAPVTKIAIKSVLAFPFTFHSWNGIRHLIWDTGSFLDLKGVYRTGYIVLGVSTVSAVALALY